MEELARVPVRRYEYNGAAIVVWVGIYRVHELVGHRVVGGGLSVTVDCVDVPVELHGDDGEAELLAKLRRWLDERS